jgi:hypothetical protein
MPKAESSRWDNGRRNESAAVAYVSEKNEKNSYKMLYGYTVDT